MNTVARRSTTRGVLIQLNEPSMRCLRTYTHMCIYITSPHFPSLPPARCIRTPPTSYPDPPRTMFSWVPLLVGLAMYTSTPFILLKSQPHEPGLQYPAPPPLESVIVTFPPDTPKSSLRTASRLYACAAVRWSLCIVSRFCVFCMLGGGREHNSDDEGV
jgi:hypothetical protein